MLKRISWIRRKAFSRSTRGFTLTEVVIAIAVLGIIVASVPLAVMTIYNAQFKQNELRIAERMARAQFEYIKSQEYIRGVTVSGIPKYSEIPNPEVGNYGIEPRYYIIDPETNTRITITGPEDDTGVQEVQIIVFRIKGESAETLYETSNYKVLR